MRPALFLTLYAVAGGVCAQSPQLEAMPLDAQLALKTSLSKRLEARLASGGINLELTEAIAKLRDKRLLDKIDSDADKLLGVGTFPSGNKIPASVRSRIEQRVRARLELYTIANSNIPDDILVDIIGHGKKQLLAKAKQDQLDLPHIKKLITAFDRSNIRKNENYRILNPKTSYDGPGLFPGPIGPGKYDPVTRRSTETVLRKSFSGVGTLVDISVKPYQIICSGTLIAKNWFLTATHCFLDKDKKTQIPLNRLGVFFPFLGGKDTLLRSDGKESKNMLHRPVSTTFAWFGGSQGIDFPTSEPEMYQQIQSGNDVALIALSVSSTQSSTQHAMIIPANAPISPPLTLAGYGLSNASEVAGDLLLEIGVRKDLVQTDTGGVMLTGHSDAVLQNGGRICTGDSGGPVFRGNIDGTKVAAFELVAIASAVIERVGGTSNPCADGIQNFTRLDRDEVRAWLCANSGAGC
jgi:hypothetical protein